MSLEAQIKELTEALRENTEALLSGGGAPAKGKAPAKSKADDEEKAPAKGGRKAKITADVMAKKYAAFLSEGSAAEKKKAKQIVKGILEHLDAERVSAIEAENWDEAVELLTQYQNGEDPLDILDGGDDDDAMI